MPSSAPRGLTLIELLVVIVILTTLVAAAIPLLSPTSDERRLRETSRGLNTFITGAQAKAIQLHRPYGIALKKLGQDTGRVDDNGVCLEVFYVEQPPPFTGFAETSSARVALYTPSDPSWYGGLRPLVLVQFVTRGNNVPTNPGDGLPVGWDADLLPGGVIRPGDVIEFNGTRYQLLSDTNDTVIVAQFDTTGTFASDTGRAAANKPSQIVALPLNDSGQLINVMYDDHGNALAPGPVDPTPPRFWTYPTSYKILRQPTLTSAEPYQLPDATAIDLRASGIGSDDYFYVPALYDNPDYVFIMFSPEGSVERLHYNQKRGDSSVPDVTFDEPVVDNLFLLVGRRENAPPVPASDDKTLDPSEWSTLTDQERQDIKQQINWLRGDSRWVVIGSQSGRVVTVENAAVGPPGFGSAWEAKRTDQIRQARTFAREMVQMGGR